VAQIRMLSWNIQVWGPGRYGSSPNNVRLVNLVGAVVHQANANVLVVMELMSSVATGICFNIGEAIINATGRPWAHVVVEARGDGDRESYGIFWCTNDNFAVVSNAAGAAQAGLASIEFPNNFSATHGRRAAFAAFRTTDTHTNFAVSVYHAPPNQQAILGLEALARTPALYTVDNAGAAQAVTGRLLGGDYNLDVTTEPAYSWLTNPVPAAPPPAAAGQGAGSTGITADRTRLGTMKAALREWGDDLANWSNDAADYRESRLDNIFYASPAAAPAAAGQVVDLVAEIMLPASPIRALAQQFETLNPATNNPAFPFAFSLPQPLAANLNFACCAWLLVNYAISDHLPVQATVTI
jgi:hypothetical protein